MPKTLNPFSDKRAQIVIPAVLLIPTIMLAIYLLFETAKLSREKIRHQFANDTSAFAELTSTSNFLNAVAYTNGAFPFRLFRENFSATKKELEVDCRVGGLCVGGNKPDNESVFNFFYQAGAFPAMPDVTSSPKDTDTEWELKYYPDTRSGWNEENPSIDNDPEEGWPIMSKEIAESHLVHFNMEAIRLYLFMYYLLSQIYENQKKVYDRITEGGEFYRKGYYLNTGNCRLSECGREGAREFKGFMMDMKSVYVKKVKIFYKNDDASDVGEFSLDLAKENLFGGRLYQFSYLERGSKDKLKKFYTGIDINQTFTPPSNYFNISLLKYKPHTHVRAALQCTKESNNCVWPNPTPKYQVRLFP
jgi:hypothetical protein